MRGGPHRNHVGDHPLERHLRMLERPQIRLPHAIQQLAERHPRLHQRPQRHHVDCRRTARHRRADDDVVLSGQPREQHCERGMQCHERTRPVCLPDTDQTLM